ncbi:MAG TPA: ANTAR domain-containing protein, partial [Actinoplanes sp.]|nr:ANTAR domain-containing protein [Actinoplanes sp.]
MDGGGGPVLGGRQAYVDAVEGLRTSAPRPAEAGRATVDRAVGLLAGRIRCRLADAHRHVLRMAQEQNRDVVEVAAGVIGLLDIPESGPEDLPPLPPPAPPVRRPEPWLNAVQQVLDVVPGAAALLTPVRDGTGRLTDLIFAAVSPDAVAADGRRGPDLIGTTIAHYFPKALVTERWAVYARVLDTGEPAELPPFRYLDGRYSVRAHRLGDGLLTSWTRHDQEAPESDRMASTERLGNLGWGEWDLVSGEVCWSAQLYRIYERDPALGPMSREESEALSVPEDLPLRL